MIMVFIIYHMTHISPTYVIVNYSKFNNKLVILFALRCSIQITILHITYIFTHTQTHTHIYIYLSYVYVCKSYCKCIRMYCCIWFVDIVLNVSTYWSSTRGRFTVIPMVSNRFRSQCRFEFRRTNPCTVMHSTLYTVTYLTKIITKVFHAQVHF